MIYRGAPLSSPRRFTLAAAAILFAAGILAGALAVYIGWYV
jgi:hypothetical protein